MVTGNMVTRLIQEFSNGSTAKPLDPDQFSLMKLDYTHRRRCLTVSTRICSFCGRRSSMAATCPRASMSGSWPRHLALPELPTMRDVIDTLMLTNLRQAEWTFNNTTISSSKMRTIKEWLVPNRNFGG